ncbi:glycoside hydrolase family 2 protein [Cohnella hashimotonis]|uniref:beta-mannosidase n=1 Tax=Cohnella hashimotonis TaxID=2826895 RepID=A0ABT6TFP4_9BACL|nr:sugar-binding domain-containing protein [Cohnella hashimotonis]MDI4645652.1 glycoside hydrolase family 2 TIM barrel-domain containing protein [Cohnella hashimotonis]
MTERYLDDLQDEAYRKSSLYGDTACEIDASRPAQRTIARLVDGDGDRHGDVDSKIVCLGPERLSLSGSWRMQDSEPADPGDPAPNTGWFGRKAKASRGMAEKWYAPGTDRSGWREVTVPTTVQRALVGLGELADPYWDTNTIDELEKHGQPTETPLWFRRTRAERSDWWFARSFEAPADWRGRRLTLRFDGIDYSGTVFLNGMSLGYHAGMFGGPDLDVTRLVDFDGPNELVVRIDQAPQSWNGIMKGSPGFGWHYGHLISLGIWKDVWLVAEPEVAVSEPYIVTRSIGPEGAVLEISYSVDNLLTEPVSLTVDGEIKLKGENAEKAHAVQFRSKLEAPIGRSRHIAEVTLRDPFLWWPAGYGEQALYDLKLDVKPGDGDGANGRGCGAGNGSPASERGASAIAAVGTETTFGVRTVEMLAAPGARPEADYRWQFVVNGVPMFIKGANWCWPDPMLEQREDLYARLIGLARRGHVQMLRAWGGGIVEEDVFYRLCDEAGILVYQEFPLCWGPMDAPYTDLGVLDRQVTASVKRLRNHPSLVMWGGGNENGEHGGADEGLHLVGRRCRGIDPSRPFHRTDPWGGSAHNWNVYHGGEPLDAATLAMPSVFYGEYGVPSMPARSSCVRFVPEEALSAWPPTEESRGWLAHFHQFSLKDVIKVMRYGAYGPITDWETYITYSQAAQGESIRFAAEIQRAGAAEGKTGFWYYKFTDLFPGHSWGVVDFYGTPKLPYYQAKRACSPRSAFAVYDRIGGWEAGETFEAELHAANDTGYALRGAVAVATVYDSGLSELWSGRYDVELEANGRIKLGRIAFKLPGEPKRLTPFLLAVILQDEKGAAISDQWYEMNAQPKTKDLIAFEQAHLYDGNEYPGTVAEEAFALYAGLPDAPLRRLPRTSLALSVESSPGGGRIRIRNTGLVPAIRVTLAGFPVDWSCYLSDNEIGLRPGEERTIAYEAPAGTALDDLTASAWNAPAIAAEYAPGEQTVEEPHGSDEGGKSHA